MSIPEKMPVSTTDEIWTTPACVPIGNGFAGVDELARLNLETCSSMFASAVRCWESLALARTPAQLIQAQADTLPWFATQIAAYAESWMNIVREASAGPGRSADTRDEGHAREVRTMLDDIAKSAKGVDAMLSAMSPRSPAPDGDVVVEPPAATRAIPPADSSRPARAAPAAAKRRGPSSRRG